MLSAGDTHSMYLSPSRFMSPKGGMICRRCAQELPEAAIGNPMWPFKDIKSNNFRCIYFCSAACQAEYARTGGKARIVATKCKYCGNALRYEPTKGNPMVGHYSKFGTKYAYFCSEICKEWADYNAKVKRCIGIWEHQGCSEEEIQQKLEGRFEKPAYPDPLDVKATFGQDFDPYTPASEQTTPVVPTVEPVSAPTEAVEEVEGTAQDAPQSEMEVKETMENSKPVIKTKVVSTYVEGEQIDCMVKNTDDGVRCTDMDIIVEPLMGRTVDDMRQLIAELQAVADMMAGMEEAVG